MRVKSSSNAFNFLFACFIPALSYLPVLRESLINGEIIIMACNNVIGFDEFEDSIILIFACVSSNFGDFAGKFIIRIRGVIEIAGFESVLQSSNSAFSFLNTLIDGVNFSFSAVKGSQSLHAS